MLVVEPSALRYEAEAATAVAEYDEHLLERVSALENKLARIADRLEQGLDLLLRHARTSYFDHVLLETLIGVLREAKTIDQEKLEELWRERCERDEEATTETGRREAIAARIIAGYRSDEPALFARLVKDGFTALDLGEIKPGIRALERAAALAPENAPLNAYLGEHFFRAGKMPLARDYLARALSAEPGDHRICLLLGLVCGDEGETVLAKNLLGEAVRRGGASFAAHYALGRLLAAEAKWDAALKEFRSALAAHECPEGYYIIGLMCLQINRHRLALRHLSKAVEMDPNYAEAFYVLGVALLRMGERRRASEAFKAARAANTNEPRYRAALRRMSRAGDVPPPPLFGVVRRGRKRLVTGGDSRLAAVLQKEALRAAATVR